MAFKQSQSEALKEKAAIDPSIVLPPPPIPESESWLETSIWSESFPIVRSINTQITLTPPQS